MPPRSDRLSKKLVELFGIDRRSLAAFRISMGVLLLCDLGKRAIEFRAHYTDDGVAPRHLIDPILPNAPGLFRAYFLTGEAWGAAILFALAALFAVTLTVGYRTRLSALASVLLLASVQLRNPLACHTGDAYLGALVFWLPFLPLGDTVSIDRLREPGRPRLPTRYLSFGTVGVLLLMLLFYLFAGLFKHREPVWMSGEALSVFLGLEAYGRPFSAFLADHPGLCKAFTYATLGLEMGAPVLLLCPFFTRWVRLVTVLLLAGFHFGIQLTVYIGIFEIVSILALVVWLPSWFWDVALPRLVPRSWQERGRRLAAAWIARWARPDYRPPGEHLPLRRPNPLVEVVAVLAIGLMVTYNIRLYYGLKTRLPFKLGATAQVLNLKQVWDIFAGIERRREGWFLVDGQLEDGTRVDLMTGAPIAGPIEEHPWTPTTFANHNMRRYFINMARPQFTGLRGAWAEYLARTWNEREATKCVALELWHIGSRPWLDRDANAALLVSWEPLALDFPDG